MKDDARETAHAAAPVWNPSADAPSQPRFRPKLKSSLPRVLLQDNRSLSNNLERKLTNLFKARARVESRWESNKRKLIVAVRSSRLLDEERRASWAPAAAAEAAAAEAEIAMARDSSASARSPLVARRRSSLSGCRRDAGNAAGTDFNTTLGDWRALQPVVSERHDSSLAAAATEQLPVHVDSASVEFPTITGPSKRAPRAQDDLRPRSPPSLPQAQQRRRGQQIRRQQSEGEPLSMTAEQQQSPLIEVLSAQTVSRITPPPLPFRQQRMPLDNSFSSRAGLALSRSLTVAPVAAVMPAPGRLQYDIHHQIEEEDRLVAFLTFRAKPKVANVGRQSLGV